MGSQVPRANRFKETKWKTKKSNRPQGEAAMLLDSDAFSSTVNQLVDASFQNFTNSTPDESVKREAAYHHYRGTLKTRPDATTASGRKTRSSKSWPKMTTIKRRRTMNNVLDTSAERQPSHLMRLKTPSWHVGRTLKMRHPKTRQRRL